ncbi:MAG: hypothetical protein JWQ09_5612 [Segetibacter sp.]|nr:hypothetical protein [Segetibacter sp.]
MAYFLYMMADEDRHNLHTGVSGDIESALNFYKDLITISWPPKKLNRLVYVKKFKTKDGAIKAMDTFTSAPLSVKIEFVDQENPDWLEVESAAYCHTN